VTCLGNDRPLFSVVVLLYNQARLVEEALESVFAQGYGPVELLVCDDASADGSADVAERWCREHASRFSGWKVLRQPRNRGILPNQLNGIRESRG
jgi:Glycosyltransferases involved in cell wall biogenesis